MRASLRWGGEGARTFRRLERFVVPVQREECATAVEQAVDESRLRAQKRVEVDQCLRGTRVAQMQRAPVQKRLAMPGVAGQGGVVVPERFFVRATVLQRDGQVEMHAGVARSGVKALLQDPLGFFPLRGLTEHRGERARHIGVARIDCEGTSQRVRRGRKLAKQMPRDAEVMPDARVVRRPRSLLEDRLGRARLVCAKERQPRTQGGIVQQTSVTARYWYKR